MAGIVDDLLKRGDELSANRLDWEKIWRDIADHALPTQSHGMRNTTQASMGAMDRLLDFKPSTPAARRRRYDSTAVVGLDRLSAGIESLVTPLAEKWHGLNINDPFGNEADDEQRDWMEKLRDFQFAVRYDPRSGFQTANQKAIRSTIAFGTGVVFSEEGFGDPRHNQQRIPFLYRNIPLSQAYIGVDAQGVPDTMFRRFPMSARAVVQRFGDKCSAKTRKMAEDPKQMDQIVNLLHAVQPRQERGSSRSTNRGSDWASFYVESQERHLIGESGFFEFPFHVYYWTQADESGYGESPLMLALDDILGLNVIRKSSLKATQQWIAPPLGVASDGVMNRPNMNAEAINYGAVDANGRLKIQPIITSQNPALAENIINSERQGVREMLFINLFQVLVNNPEMTATEAMIRANEKGELLGPAGARIQAALSSMIDREIGILKRKGAFEQGAALEIPASMNGQDFSVKFTSPLDRIRQAKEGQAVAQAYQFAGQVSQAKGGDPSVFDNLDDDESMRFVSRVFGAPEKVLRNSDERDAIREARAKELAAQKNIAATKELAQAAGAATPALEAMMQQGGGQTVAPLPLPALAPPPA